MKVFSYRISSVVRFVRCAVATFGLISFNPAFSFGIESQNMRNAANEETQTASLLSAFFGLDNELPFRANLLCIGGSGMDGMPVVLSHTIDPDVLEAEQFQILTRSGDVRVPKCVTLRPANDPGERRTVLLVGEFGDEPNDPPVLVRVVGDLPTDGEPSLNFKGTEVDVTPLSAGPSLVLATPVPKNQWSESGRGTSCPESGTLQVIRVTWNGGVSLPNGDELSEEDRQLYRVTVERADGSSEEISPAAIAELEDNDNNHFLCLETADPARAVSFPAGHLVDPNMDLNHDTSVPVSSTAD